MNMMLTVLLGRRMQVVPKTTCRVSGNEVYYTNSLTVLVNNMLCREFHCPQKYFNSIFILFSSKSSGVWYKCGVAGVREGVVDGAVGKEDAGRARVELPHVRVVRDFEVQQLERPKPVSQGGNNLKDLQDFRTEIGSSRGQNLAYLFQIRSIAVRVVRERQVQQLERPEPEAQERS
jgi:hypothetical protein